MDSGLRLVDTTAPPAAPPPDTPTSDGITFTLKGAADACQVDPQTIRRRLDQLEEHGARRNEDGSYSIPLSALLAAGFRPGKPAPPDSTPDQSAVSPGDAPPAPGDIPPAAAARITELERLLVEEHAALLVEQAHRQAADRVADTLERALRMLEARESPVPAQTTEVMTSVEPERAAPARRWWRRPRPLLVAERGPS